MSEYYLHDIILHYLFLLYYRWHSLKSLTSDKQVTLSTALERARVFHADLKELVDKFNRAEELATIMWNPHCLPDTCQRDIDEHAEYMIIVQGLKDPMNIIKSEGEGLKSQGNLEDQEIVDRWATDLKDRWDELMATAEEKQVCTNYYTSYVLHTSHPHITHPTLRFIIFFLTVSIRRSKNLC